MIPNKIYLPKYPNYDIEGEHLGDDWSCEPEFTDNVTYIRKYALLKKLEKVAAEYKKRSDEGELVWQNMCGINEAIDIINSL